ncbi:MAG: helix-turn-helix domain-containing protein [Saccharopolyspora sp.]|uniref:helix-turn-helix transcriptional regulator n=1 Tax=Saccharopolyspora sp. TaxID=33915 RepID=UPI0025D8A4F7|nr:helix-turn-helix domain-containing protein [Saccharopolyspora sp.]MBQ6643511.1 helix-turn-helix domain-containing protein [Saccharopolyspora sp.]
MQKLWGPQDVANFFGIPVSTVYQWRTRGTGPIGKRVGKHVRYRSEDVESWFDAQPDEAI